MLQAAAVQLPGSESIRSGSSRNGMLQHEHYSCGSGNSTNRSLTLHAGFIPETKTIRRMIRGLFPLLAAHTSTENAHRLPQRGVASVCMTI